MFTRSFWLGAAERSIRAAAGSLLVLWTTDVPLNLLDVQPLTAAGVAAGAAVVSLLTSIASVPVSGGDGSGFLSGGR